MRRWFSLAWRLVAAASVIHWIVSSAAGIVLGVLTLIAGYAADLPGAALIASAIVVFALALLVGVVIIPIRGEQALRGDLQNLAGALEYDLGYIRRSTKPPHVYVGRWPEIHERLARRSGLEATYRAAERAFQAINRHSEGVEEAPAVVPEVEAALAAITESLAQLSPRP